MYNVTEWDVRKQGLKWHFFFLESVYLPVDTSTVALNWSVFNSIYCGWEISFHTWRFTFTPGCSFVTPHSPHCGHSKFSQRWPMLVSMAMTTWHPQVVSFSRPFWNETDAHLFSVSCTCQAARFSFALVPGFVFIEGRAQRHWWLRIMKSLQGKY